MGLEDITAAVLFALVVAKVIDAIKLLNAKKFGAFLTQLMAFAGGTIVVVLAAHSTYGSGVHIAKIALSDTDGPAQILAGIAVGSLGSAIVDWRKAKDNTDSAAIPGLDQSARA